jgi:plastocyanin
MRMVRTLAWGLMLAAALWSCGAPASPSATPAAASGATRPTVTIVVRDMAMTPTRLSIPAGQPFRIAFENQDSTMAHGLAIEAGTNELWHGDPIEGPGSVTYDVPALSAGTYTVYCEVHFGISAQLDAVSQP